MNNKYLKFIEVSEYLLLNTHQEITDINVHNYTNKNRNLCTIPMCCVYLPMFCPIQPSTSKFMTVQRIAYESLLSRIMKFIQKNFKSNLLLNIFEKFSSRLTFWRLFCSCFVPRAQESGNSRDKVREKMN